MCLCIKGESPESLTPPQGSIGGLGNLNIANNLYGNVYCYGTVHVNDALILDASCFPKL